MNPDLPQQPELPSPQPVPQPSPQPVPQPPTEPLQTPGQVYGTPPAPVPPAPIQEPLQAQPIQAPSPSPVPPSPTYGTAAPQPASASVGKKVLIGAAAVVLIAVLAAGAAILLKHKDGKSPVASISKKITGSSDVMDRSDGTLDLSKLIDRNETIKNQDIKAKMNQQVNLSDGTSYMVTSVQRNFVSTSHYLKAEDGKELVKINLTVGNRKKSGTLYISSYLFSVRNSAGGLKTAEYVTKSDMDDTLNSQDIEPGKQIKGALVFEVDKDEKLQALVSESKYKSLNSDKQITIKSEVAL